MKKLIFFSIVALIGLGYTLYVTSPIYKLKNNKNLELVCEFQNGYRVVPKNKILGFDDEKNIWIFTNGFAHSCEIEKVDN